MNAAIGWILIVLVGAAAVWLLLLWWSFRQHARRNAAPSAAPVVRTSLPPAPTTTAPAPAPAAAALAPRVAPAATAPAATTPTAPPPAGTLPPLPKEPWFWKWVIRIGVSTIALIVFAAVIWLIAYLSSKTGNSLDALWAAVKGMLAGSLYWVLGLVAVGLVIWFIWRTWFKATPPAQPATPTGTNPAAGGTPGGLATPTAAEISAARAAAFREAVDLEKLRLKKSAARRNWFWKLSTVGILAFGIWAIWIRPQANGLTPSQEFVASSGVTAPSPEVWRYTEQEAASGRLIWKTDDVRILERVRGQEPRFMFSVPSPYQGITSHSRYEWSLRLPEGIVENRERNMRLRFVGNFISDILFTGSYTANGQTYTFRLEHVR